MSTEILNIRAQVACPFCGHEAKVLFQTYWLAGFMSFLNEYELGERIPDLHGVQAAVIDGVTENLRGSCKSCKKKLSYGARIVDEAVVEVFPLAEATSS